MSAPSGRPTYSRRSTRSTRPHDPDDIVNDPAYAHLHGYRSGIPFDALIKLLKWVPIEQDVTYWNWTGRLRPMDGIRREYEVRFGSS